MTVRFLIHATVAIDLDKFANETLSSVILSYFITIISDIVR